MFSGIPCQRRLCRKKAVEGLIKYSKVLSGISRQMLLLNILECDIMLGGIALCYEFDEFELEQYDKTGSASVLTFENKTSELMLIDRNCSIPCMRSIVFGADCDQAIDIRIVYGKHCDQVLTYYLETGNRKKLYCITMDIDTRHHIDGKIEMLDKKEVIWTFSI